MKSDDVASFVDDDLVSLLLIRPFPYQWTEADRTMWRKLAIHRIGEPSDETLVPANTNDVRQVTHLISFEGEIDPLSDLLHEASWNFVDYHDFPERGLCSSIPLNS